MLARLAGRAPFINPLPGGVVHALGGRSLHGAAGFGDDEVPVPCEVRQLGAVAGFAEVVDPDEFEAVQDAVVVVAALFRSLAGGVRGNDDLRDVAVGRPLSQDGFGPGFVGMNENEVGEPVPEAVEEFVERLDVGFLAGTGDENVGAGRLVLLFARLRSLFGVLARLVTPNRRLLRDVCPPEMRAAA